MSVTVPPECVDPTVGAMLLKCAEGKNTSDVLIAQRHTMICEACRNQIMKAWQLKHGLATEEEGDAQ